MDLVLRAYDSATVGRAEAMPIEQLLTALRRGALRATDKRRAGLEADEDIYARETIAERLEGLIQVNLGERSLTSLSAIPGEGAAPIPLHGATIDADEAIALREDLVRDLTYGLWRAPEEVVSHILGVVVGLTDFTRLLGDPTAFAELQAVLDIAQDDDAFAARFGEAVRASLARAKRPADKAAVRHELAAFGQVLGPIARLLHGAQAVGLRVIAYRDEPGADGLTHFLAQDRSEPPEESLPIPRMNANGHGGHG
jgi:hypothetical protein